MRVAVVGAAGGIGASVAYNLVTQGVGDEILLIDRADAVLTTHLMDIEQLRVAVRPFEIRRADLRDAVEADVVVVSASVPFRRDLPRMEYLAANLSVFDEIADTFADTPDWGGVMVVASNPVDPLVTHLVRRTGLDRRRVLGYTLNDSLRLRFGIAQALAIDPHRVTAWVLGEHGDQCVPIYSHVSVDGNPVDLAPELRRRATEYMLNWYPAWVSLGVTRTSTWISGNGVARMVQAIATHSDATWPASYVLDGEYDICGVAVGLPVGLGPAGVERVERWSLTDDEREALLVSAEYVERSLEDALAVRASEAMTDGH